jgi:hypothetical protein
VERSRTILRASAMGKSSKKARGGIQATTRAADYRSVQSPPPKLRDYQHLSRPALRKRERISNGESKLCAHRQTKTF